MTLQKALLLLVLMMGLAFVYACGDDDDDGDDGGADTDTDTDTDADPCDGVTCDDVDAGTAAAMWSCRATSFGNPMCMDYPKATYTEQEAEDACQASIDQGGGTLDEWVTDSNCAVDQINTTWRCDGTMDTGGNTVPLYYAYAETLPTGICVSALGGTIVDRPADCCWKDYD